MSYGGEEYEYEWPDDQEQDGWPDDDNQENDDGTVAPKVQIENDFYEAEGNMRDQPADALAQFERCVQQEEELNEGIQFRFKAMEYIVILRAQLGQYPKMKENMTKILGMLDQVPRNDVSDAMNNILDAVSRHLGSNMDLQKEMYAMTLEKLKTQNQQLWFTNSLRLGKIYLDQQSYGELNTLLSNLKDCCRKKQEDDGDQIMQAAAKKYSDINDEYDTSKSSFLLETFALEIQMCDKIKDKKRMQRIYPKTERLQAVINDPKVMGIIKECGGKMYMTEKKWEKALNELFECFKYYQECGNLRAKEILLYVILASMLSKSEINHVDTREAKVYKDDKQVIAITSLHQAYEKNDIKNIQKILQDSRHTFLRDPEFAQYLDDLLRSIRLNVLESKVKPYRTIRLDFLAKELNISLKEVRQLLSELILEERLDAKIDQLSGFLEINQRDANEERYKAMESWANALVNVHMNLTHQKAV